MARAKKDAAPKKAKSQKPKQPKEKIEKGLTPRQEAFAMAYIETGNATEAYRRCYSVSRMKPNVINVKASELLATGKVAVRVRELMARHSERHDITVDSLTKMLKDAYTLAMKDEVQAPAAAVSAVLGMGRLHGLIVDKKHVIGDHKFNLSSEPVSESAAWISKVLGRGEDRAPSKSLPH